jgi:hypothetical protein
MRLNKNSVLKVLCLTKFVLKILAVIKKLLHPLPHPFLFIVGTNTKQIFTASKVKYVTV